MNAAAPLEVALLALAVALAVGVYFVAVADGLVARIVTGDAIRPGAALLAPARTAAWLITQARTTTERPDARTRRWAVVSA